ncbi:MAG TPA: DUF4760 domain-containing protein [Blastocatellia bacterium]|nr:DUF4760 domain-containing protein [Blastocatellia bacterium]
MDKSEIIKICIAGVVAIIALIQLGIGVHSFKADHKRRKKQATIEYMSKIRDVYTTIDYELLKKYGKVLVETQIKEIFANHEERTKLMKLLGMFEHLAVGANTDVFDIDVLNRMSGAYMIRLFNQYSGYIKQQRKVLKNDSIYKEFEDLVDRLSGLRGT